METTERTNSPYPNIPPAIESNDGDYRDSGIPSTLAIAGHPIHPVIVTLPIAFLVGALGSDVAYWITTDFFWAKASMWLIGVGFVSGILAGITGMFDFFNIKRVRDRSAGWLHMAGNIVALVLTLINWLLRMGNPELSIVPWGLALSAIVGVLLGVTGWFGGELTFRHKIGAIGTTREMQS
ncbi:DUF2231 domain-containing protein [Phormidium sp. CCY1219]|jgi:uncharacterized membrane protein|uniref:DUF2231 domain-containing protein n=1 Tax=Phormidium sp. CCY1219 TaxID=2886104 RepID=UPI002D1ED95C|nr:DUF2231 domain-containing protein [Phormidium sp. CCY1219]MEB3829788.1 DUF2231 domain-containing protein [Phormidium sp. CCY1219]